MPLRVPSFIKHIIAILLLSTLSLGAAEKPLSLDDLGMPGDEAKANTQLQQDLNKRSSMLQWHQWLGLAAAVPMWADYLIGDDVKHNSTTRSWHIGLGISTAALYMAAASFAIFAPKPDGIKDTGSTKFHRWLSYLHFPLMIAVPILGNLARMQIEDGQRVTGAGSLHGAAATTLVATYTLAITIMVFNF